MVYIVRLDAFHTNRGKQIFLDFIVSYTPLEELDREKSIIAVKDFVSGYYDFSGLTHINMTVEPILIDIGFQIISKYHTEKEIRNGQRGN